MKNNGNDSTSNSNSSSHNAHNNKPNNTNKRNNRPRDVEHHAAVREAGAVAKPGGRQGVPPLAVRDAEELDEGGCAYSLYVSGSLSSVAAVLFVVCSC